MPYKVAIRNNATGEIRIHEGEGNWEMDDPNTGFGSSYWWLEGNGGCDCNREALWRRAGGEDVSGLEVPCSDGRFAVLYAQLPNGIQVPLELEN